MVQIRDSSSGLPISNVSVSVLTGGEVVSEAKTGEDGLVKFGGLIRGSYLVQVSKPGYRDLLDPRGAGRSWVVGSVSASLIIPLSRTAAVSGSVYKRDGQIAAGVQIVAISQRDASAGFNLAQNDGTPPIMTDDDGTYRIYNLLPGRYTVAALPSAEESSAGEVPAPSFLPGTADLTTAQFIDLNAGEEYSGADLLIVDAAQTYNLIGKLSGTPASWNGEHAAVTLSTRGAFQVPVARGTADSEGHFKLTNIPAGNYQITAFGPAADWGADGPAVTLNSRAASATVSIAGSDQNIALSLQPLIRVDGQLVLTDGANQSSCGPFDRISFHPDDGWLSVFSQAVFSPPIKLRNDRFTVQGLPAGHYTVDLPGLAEPCRVIQVVIGNRDSPTRSSLLDGSAPIKLVVSAASGSISGRAEPLDGNAAGFVVLLNEEGGYPAQVVTVDATSNYRFNKVPPGRYQLTARRLLASGIDLDPSTIDRSKSKTVTVEAGQDKIVNLRIGL